MEIKFYCSLDESDFFGGRHYIVDKNATITGRYKEKGREIYVEFEVRKWFFKTFVWVNEDYIHFTEAPVIYNCREKKD